MNNYPRLHNYLPLHLLIVYFALTLLLDFIPLGTMSIYRLPEWTALLLIYCVIYYPTAIGLISAFILGLLIDVGTAAPLGQHALAYIMLAFLVQQRQSRLEVSGMMFQVAYVFLALVLNNTVISLVHWLYDQRFTGWLVFLSAPVIGALIWPLVRILIQKLLRPRS